MWIFSGFFFQNFQIHHCILWENQTSQLSGSRAIVEQNGGKLGFARGSVTYIGYLWPGSIMTLKRHPMLLNIFLWSFRALVSFAKHMIIKQLLLVYLWYLHSQTFYMCSRVTVHTNVIYQVTPVQIFTCVIRTAVVKEWKGPWTCRLFSFSFWGRVNRVLIETMKVLL